MDPSAHFEAKTLSLMDRFSQFAVVAARQAIADAGLEERCGPTTATIIGSGVGGQTTLDDSHKRRANATHLHPFTIPRREAATPTMIIAGVGDKMRTSPILMP